METVHWTPRQRAEQYNLRFPDRPPLASTPDWVVGAWCIGACYRNPNPLHGAYPHGYLERVHAMFPDARRVLHAFSGGLTERGAIDALGWPITHDLDRSIQMLALGLELQLVDQHGPEDGRHPTWQGDVCAMPEDWAGRFDLVLADPPYSSKDAEVYGTPMPNRAKVMRALARVTRPGGNLVWLDTRWPMHRKDQWRCWGHVALVRSTNHRVRLVSMFERAGR